MPFGGLLSLGSGLLGVGSGIAGLINGTPASNVPQAATYNYQNQAGADQGAYGGIGQLSNYNIGANYLPQYQSLVSNLMPQNNPYAAGYQSGSNATGAAGMASGQSLLGQGQGLGQSGNTLINSSLSQLPNVQSLMNLGFDPQNALYAQLQNQNQQQNAAILGQSGVASTPYGAGVQQQANTNFNIDWQNQQLARASQAAGAAGGLLGNIAGGATQGAGLQSTGANLSGTGLQQMQSGASLPYSTYTGINNDSLAALTGAAGYGNTTSSIPQTTIQDYLSYLTGATGQQNSNIGAQNANVNQANSAFNQSTSLGNSIGSGLSKLASGWGSAFGGSGGTGNFNTVSTPWGSMPMAA